MIGLVRRSGRVTRTNDRVNRTATGVRASSKLYPDAEYIVQAHESGVARGRHNSIRFHFKSETFTAHEGHAKRKKKLTRSRTITSSKRTKQKKTLRHQFSVNIGIRTPYNFVFSVARVWRSTIGLGQSTWTPGCSTQTVLWMIASTAHVHISLKIHLYSTQHSIHIGWRRRRRWWQQWCSRTVQLCRYNALRWAIHTFSVCCLPFHSS